jgi:hypothetical protein
MTRFVTSQMVLPAGNITLLRMTRFVNSQMVLPAFGQNYPLTIGFRPALTRTYI